MIVPMSDVASALSGGAFVYLVQVLRRRRPVGPVCQCSHGYVFHDAETGKCHHVDSQYEKRYEIDRDADGNPVRDRHNEVERSTKTVHVGDVACTCRMYARAEHPTCKKGSTRG